MEKKTKKRVIKKAPSLEMPPVPSYFSEFENYGFQIQVTFGRILPKVLPMPSKTEPFHVSSAYRPIANAIGICPYELHTIMTSELNPNNQLVVDALKKLITAVKITNEVDLGKVREALWECEKTFQQKTKDHQESLVKHQNAKQTREDDITEAKKNSAEFLRPILQDIRAKLKISPNIDHLDPWERALLITLKDFNQSTVRLTKGKATVQVNKTIEVLTTEPSLLVKLFPRAEKVVQSEVRGRLEKWLYGANIVDLEYAISNDLDPEIQREAKAEINRREAYNENLRRF